MRGRDIQMSIKYSIVNMEVVFDIWEITLKIPRFVCKIYHLQTETHQC